MQKLRIPRVALWMIWTVSVAFATWYLTIALVVGRISRAEVEAMYKEMTESASLGRNPNKLLVPDTLYRSNESHRTGDGVISYEGANELYGPPVSFQIVESVLLPFYIKRTIVRVNRTKATTEERLTGFDYTGFLYVSVSPISKDDQ